MPSTRDPVAVVQPGPGRLPANTVPANALIFPPGGGSDAALQAHITDPVGAHADSAISTLGFTGATWSDPAGSVQTALTRSFEGLNARSAWVLDANAANDADFTGANALINAIAAIVAGTRAQLYLRPGTYNWDNSVSISNTTIIGAVPHTASGTNRTVIQNLAGDLRFGAFCTVRNVHFDLSGELRLVGGFGIGFNSLTHVSLDVTGDIDVASVGNTFQRVIQSDGSAAPSYINDTAGFTTYIDCFFSQVSMTGASPNTISNLAVTDINPPKYPALPILNVTSDYNRFTGVVINGSTGFTERGLVLSGSFNSLSAVAFAGLVPTIAASHGISVTGTSNTIAGLSISGSDLSAAGAASLLSITGTSNVVTQFSSEATVGGSAPIVSVTGDQNTIDTIEVFMGSVSSHIVNVTSSYNTIKSLKIDGVTVTGAFSALRFTEDGNRAEGVLLTNLSGFTEPLLWVDGTGALDPRNNTVTNLVIDTISGQADKFVWIAGIGNQLQGYKLTNSTTSTAAAPAISISGSANLVQNMLLADSSFAASVIEFLTTDESTVENVDIEDVDASTTFRIVHFSFSANGTVRNGRLNGCEILGATGALINFVSSSSCVVDTFVVNASGGTTPLAAPVAKWSSGSCLNSILRNLSISSIQNTEVEPLIDIDTTFAQGVLLENLTINSNAISHIRITGSTLNYERVIRIAGAGLENNEVTNASHNINISACGMPVILEGVWSKSRDTDAYAIGVVDSYRVSAKDCVFLGERGASGSSTNSGTEYINCKFVGGDESVGSGVQIFRGHGHNGTTYEIAPMVLRDCTIEYSAANCAPAAAGTPSPVIFFGGSGTAATVNHGPIQVGGLSIYPGANVTAQHRDDLLDIDTRQTVNGLNHGSFFKNITINLQEIPWTTDGGGRAVILGTDASIVAVDAGSATGVDPSTSLENLQILNIKEGTITDARNLVYARGAGFRNLIVEGPSSATHGTGEWGNESMLYLEGCVVNTASLFRKNGLNVNGSLLVKMISSTIRDLIVTNNLSTSSPGVLVWMEDSTSSNLPTILEGAKLTHQDGTLGQGILILNDATRAIIRGCTLLNTDSSFTARFIDVISTEGSKIVDNILRTTANIGSIPTAIFTQGQSNFNLISGNFIEDIGMSTLPASEEGTIHISGGSYNIISGNTVNADVPAGFGTFWWVVFLDDTDNIVTGNLLRNDNSSASHIRLEARSSDNVITNNLMWIDSTAGTPNIITSAGSGNNVIAGNILRNTDTGTGLISPHATDQLGTSGAVAPGVNKLT